MLNRFMCWRPFAGVLEVLKRVDRSQGADRLRAGLLDVRPRAPPLLTPTNLLRVRPPGPPDRTPHPPLRNHQEYTPPPAHSQLLSSLPQRKMATTSPIPPSTTASPSLSDAEEISEDDLGSAVVPAGGAAKKKKKKRKTPAQKRLAAEQVAAAEAAKAAPPPPVLKISRNKVRGRAREGREREAEGSADKCVFALCVSSI